jgi:hypothetical protein
VGGGQAAAGGGLLITGGGGDACAQGGNLLHTLQAVGEALKPSSVFVKTFDIIIPSNKPRIRVIPICIVVNFMKSPLIAREGYNSGRLLGRRPPSPTLRRTSTCFRKSGVHGISEARTNHFRIAAPRE